MTEHTAETDLLEGENLFAQSADEEDSCDFAAPYASEGELIGEVGDLAFHVIRDLALAEDIWRKFQEDAWYTPFQDFDWVRTWFEATGINQGFQPHIVIGYRDNKPVILLPLAIGSLHGIRQLCWMAQDVNDYNAQMVLPSFAKTCDRAMGGQIWSVILQSAVDVDILNLTRVPGTVARHPNGMAPEDVKEGICSAHLLNLKPDWSTFYTKICSSRFRKRMRDKRRKLSGFGHVQFRNERDPDKRRELVRQAIAWKSTQLEATGDRNPFEVGKDGRVSRLERCLLAYASDPSAAKKIRFEALYINGNPVAIDIVLVAGAQYSVLITAHAADATSKYSPGTVLLVRMMELATRAGYQQFDLLAGDEPYKMTWCDEDIMLYDVVRGLSLKGHGVAVLLRGSGSIKTTIKRNPQLMKSFRTVNKWRLSLR